MMRSMFSGVSGLRVHQTKMDVIAHNIANVNTVGYKASRVTFAEVFSQTISGASGQNTETGRGGVNPMQIGLGANVASIDKLMTTGAAQRTDNPFDVMIQGDGFFIVGDASGTYFTRAGAMGLDEYGNLVNSMGLQVMGWDASKDMTVGSKTYGEYVVQKGVAKPIVIAGEKEYMDAASTTMIRFEGNLNADTSPDRQSTMDFYDSVGNRYVVDVLYHYTPSDGTNPANWSVSVGNVAYVNGDRTKPGVGVEVSGAGQITLKGVAPVGTQVSFETAGVANAIAFLQFDENGRLTQSVPGNGSGAPGTVGADPSSISLKILTDPPSPGSPLTPDAVFGNATNDIALDFSILRQTNDIANPQAIKRDGNKPGTLAGISIGPDGTITGRYSNSTMRVLGQICVARFANPGGMEKVGDNLFVPTANSGDFNGIGEEVSAGGGKIMAGVLEMSNVDLAAEFTEMITTQRGFQANSRTITTSDEMLQELVNLKR